MPPVRRNQKQENTGQDAPNPDAPKTGLNVDDFVQTVRDPVTGEENRTLGLADANDPDKLRAALESASSEEAKNADADYDLERASETARAAAQFRQTLDLRDPAHGSPVVFVGE